MKKQRDPIDELCQDWVRWCQTRGMYLKKAAGSMLGRFQPHKSGREPNARNHADMMYFNMAVHAALDMPKWARKGLSFLAYYTADIDSVKKAADDLAISRRTFYEHVKAFSGFAHRLSLGIKKSHEENFGPGAPERPTLPAAAAAVRPAAC